MKISGRKIKEIRMEKGMSRTKLAKETDIPLRTLQDWECEKRKPSSVEKVLLIAQILKVDVEAFDIEQERPLDFDEQEGEREYVTAVNDIYKCEGIRGIARLLDRFADEIGLERANKIIKKFKENQ